MRDDSSIATVSTSPVLGGSSVQESSLAEGSHDVTSFDSAIVFLLKVLLYPVITVLFLGLCVWYSGRSLSGPYFLIALLSFAGVAEFMGDSRIVHSELLTAEIRNLGDMSIRWLGIVSGVVLILYLCKFTRVLNDRILLIWFLFTPLLLWMVTIGVRHLLLRIGIKLMQPRSAVIVGVTEQGMQLHQALQRQPLLRINAQGFFVDRNVDHLGDHCRDHHEATFADAESPVEPISGPILGGLADVAAYVRTHGVNLVYITLPMSRHPRTVQLIEALRDTVASVYFVPDFHIFNHVQARLDVMHGIPMIAVCESPFFGVSALAKRCMDFLIALIALICISPVMLAVLCGVKLGSRGPAIFKQKRYGLDGREIMVYKFRSMTVTEDGAQSYTQVTRNDRRVTPFGAFIRRTSLDELPQLFNVLEGSMSLVGPRPHAIAVNEHYRSLIPSYMIRHKIKPGITGWAQVNGYRGGDDLPSMTKRIEFDLNYIANWSLWLDLKIIVRTITVLLKDRHAY